MSAEHTRAWRERNPERAREVQKVWGERNPGRKSELNREWNAQNKDRKSELLMQWKEQHPDEWRELRQRHHRVGRANRAAARFGSEGKLKVQDWDAVLAQYGSLCLACSSTAPVTIDHVVPLAMGGANRQSNLQPICFSCNSRKGTKTIDYREIAACIGWE